MAPPTGRGQIVLWTREGRRARETESSPDTINLMQDRSGTLLPWHGICLLK